MAGDCVIVCACERVCVRVRARVCEHEHAPVLYSRMGRSVASVSQQLSILQQRTRGTDVSLREEFPFIRTLPEWNFWVVRSSFNFRSPAAAARAHGPTAEARGLPPLRVPTSDLRLSSCHHSHPDGAEATSPAILTRFRVMISDAQRLFVCLLTIPISSLEQCLFGPSAHFKIRLFALVFGLCLFCMEL